MNQTPARQYDENRAHRPIPVEFTAPPEFPTGGATVYVRPDPESPEYSERAAKRLSEVDLFTGTDA